MISGFVFYRMGYFESSETASALHVSPNGGELLNSNAQQDTTQETIQQTSETPILPSSKSIAPVFDLEKYEQEHQRDILPSSKSAVRLIDGKDVFKPTELENPYLYSSKSMTHPIKFEFDNIVSTEQNRQAIKAQPELIQEDYEENVSKAQKKATKHDSISADEQAVEAEPLSEEVEENHKGIAWRTIGIGLLGIVFVSIGSIVYFKRRSK